MEGFGVSAPYAAHTPSPAIWAPPVYDQRPLRLPWRLKQMPFSLPIRIRHAMCTFRFTCELTLN